MEKNNGITINLGSDDVILTSPTDSIRLPIARATVPTEINEELTLPDYLPEIRRLVSVTPTVSMPSGYTGSDLAEFTGTVGFSVIYVGSDGVLTGTEFTSGYEASLEFELPDGILPDVRFESTDSITPSSCSARAIAPRKLNVRLRLEHCITVYGDVGISADVFGESEPSNVKRLRTVLPCCRRVTAYGDSEPISEGLSLPEGCKIIDTCGSVRIEEINIAGSGFTCRGSINATVLYSDPSGAVQRTERRLPFTADAPADIAGDGWEMRAYGSTDGLRAESLAEGSVIKGSVSVFFEAARNEPAEFTTDIFSIGREAEITTTEFKVPCLVTCANLNGTHDGSASFDGLSGDAKTVNASCRAVFGGICVEKGRSAINVNCRYSVIFEDGGEFSCREVEQPMKIDLGTLPADGTQAACELTVTSCRVRAEGENYALSADVVASVCLVGESAVSAVRSADFGRETKTSGAVFTVVYVKEGDTLWKLAKKYSRDPGALAAENGIKAAAPDSAESLSGVKFLVV